MKPEVLANQPGFEARARPRRPAKHHLQRVQQRWLPLPERTPPGQEHDLLPARLTGASCPEPQIWRMSPRGEIRNGPDHRGNNLGDTQEDG